MPIKGTARSFFTKAKFLVEVDGLGSAEFAKAGPLEFETAKIEHFEGGRLIPFKIPGKVSFTDLVLERGATKDRELNAWCLEVSNVAANSGAVPDEMKRNLDVVAQERDNSEMKRFRVYGAWPTKYTAGDWDNGADEVVIESVTLTYDYYEEVGNSIINIGG